MRTKKIKSIEQAPLTLEEKAELILIHAGEKPATELLLVDREKYDGETGTMSSSSKQVTAVKNLLEKLRLPYQLGEPFPFVQIERYDGRNWIPVLTNNYQPIVVANTPETRDAFLQADKKRDTYALGRLFGYPETAIQAYHGDRPPFMGIFHDDETCGHYTQFVFSQEFFREEYESTSLRWESTVKRLSPKIHEEIRERGRDYPTISTLAWR